MSNTGDSSQMEKSKFRLFKFTIWNVFLIQRSILDIYAGSSWQPCMDTFLYSNLQDFWYFMSRSNMYSLQHIFWYFLSKTGWIMTEYITTDSSSPPPPPSTLPPPHSDNLTTGEVCFGTCGIIEVINLKEIINDITAVAWQRAFVQNIKILFKTLQFVYISNLHSGTNRSRFYHKWKVKYSPFSHFVGFHMKIRS